MKLKEKIEKLEPIKPFSQKDQVHYFFQLGLLFREVVELVHQVPVTDKTLKELRKDFSERITSLKNHRDEIIEFFEKAELIKFAEKHTTLENAKEYHNKVCYWTQMLISQKMALDKQKQELKRTNKLTEGRQASHA